MLKVRRAHPAQRIEDLEWELFLLLQVADGSTCAWGDIESHRMLWWPSVGVPSSWRLHDQVNLLTPGKKEWVSEMLLGPGVCAPVSDTLRLFSKPGL